MSQPLPYQILGFCLAVLVILVVLRKERPEMALVVSLAAGTLLLLYLLSPLGQAFRLLRDLGIRAGVEAEFTGLILKIIGLAYLAELASSLARDAGEGALATKVEILAKVTMVVMSAPLIAGVAETLAGIVK